MNVAKLNYESLRDFFRAGNRVPKEQVMQVFGVEEREARDMIAEVANELPIIALPSHAGYRMACDPSNPLDVSEVLATLMDHQSRCRKLKKRDRPLMEFVRRARECRE